MDSSSSKNTVNKETKMIFAYFDLRRRSVVPKMLLHYLNLNYEDKVYKDRNDYYKSDKFSLKIPFINIPYLIDGDFKLTETDAINSYIIEKSGKVEMLGKNTKDRARVRQIDSMVSEMVENAINVAFLPKEEYPQKREDAYKKTQEPKMRMMDQFLEGKDWVLGYITLADFKLFQITELLLGQDPNFLNDFKNLKNHYERIKSLDSMVDYVKSKEYRPYLLPSICNYSASQCENDKKFFIGWGQ